MMSIMLLVLIISANCMKINCDEEVATTESLNGVLEKTELFSADPEDLQSKTENKENENNASKISEDSEEIRVSRSSSELSPNNESRSDDYFKLHSTESTFTEKSTSDEIISEPQGRQADKDTEQLTRRTNSATEEDKKSSENVKEQLKELPEASRSASEAEDRKTEDLSEASSESKLSDNEKAFPKVDEIDRNSETEKVKENSNESGLNEGRDTRRMFSAPDNIVVDLKMRADTTSTAVEPEVKTALNQNLNTFNNLNEFGTNSNFKLTDSSRTAPFPVTAKPIVPVNTKLAPQQIMNQRYLPKFYPRPELDIHFPNVNSDFQGPRDLPVYLKVKQDEYQPQYHFTGTQLSQFKSAQENAYFNPSNQHQYNQPQKSQHTQGTFTNKKVENLQIEVPKLYQNQVPKDFRGFKENNELANVYQGPRNQNQQFYPNQEKVNSNYKNFGDFNHEQRNGETQENSKIPLNNDNRGNQYQLFRPPQGVLDTKTNLDEKQFETERLANSYYNVRYPPKASSPQQLNVLNAQNKADIIPENIKVLFQRLASASLFPMKSSANLYSNNNIQHYPHFTNAGYTADFPFYDLSYIPGCC